MSVEEYKSRYKGMSQSDVRKLARTDSDFRDATERIYTASFHTALNKNCGDCWCDAYALIMLTANDKLMERSNRHYELRAGALLRDVRKDDNTKLYSRSIISERIRTASSTSASILMTGESKRRNISASLTESQSRRRSRKSRKSRTLRRSQLRRERQ